MTRIYPRCCMCGHSPVEVFPEWCRQCHCSDEPPAPEENLLPGVLRFCAIIALVFVSFSIIGGLS